MSNDPEATKSYDPLLRVAMQECQVTGPSDIDSSTCQRLCSKIWTYAKEDGLRIIDHSSVDCKCEMPSTESAR